MLKSKKSLSQNFLNDGNIRKKIIKQTDVTNKIILEIGAGYGFMTDYILEKKPKKIILIEKDNNLIEFLNTKYKHNQKVIIIKDDILKYSLKNYKNLIVISNLPYNISTKIILHLFNYNKYISEMILMIQKEVAEKFDYNLNKMNRYKFLTKIVSTYVRCFNVSPNVFIPKPRVNSTVVKFKFNKKNYDIKRAIFFSNKIFKNVRKKIYNNLGVKTNTSLDNKRVNELNINELLTIYNFF